MMMEMKGGADSSVVIKYKRLFGFTGRKLGETSLGLTLKRQLYSSLSLIVWFHLRRVRFSPAAASVS